MIVSAGAILGLALFASSRSLVTSLLPLDFPSFASPRTDLRVVAYTVASVLFTVFAVTVIPVWQSSQHDPQSALTTGDSRGNVPGQHRTRNIIAVIEVALSVTLTVGAGLIIKGLWRIGG